ncbi:MAG: hypothetical protein BWX79_01653 [Alphaproteobacteria bacterium ADurb.Bin100]|nr:MAG: hypothetical protein BWX79_01653 [Alphaproteobacteria bacterium ADurb.Bin100]
MIRHDTADLRLADPDRAGEVSRQHGKRIGREQVDERGHQVATGLRAPGEGFDQAAGGLALGIDLRIRRHDGHGLAVVKQIAGEQVTTGLHPQPVGPLHHHAGRGHEVDVLPRRPGHRQQATVLEAQSLRAGQRVAHRLQPLQRALVLDLAGRCYRGGCGLFLGQRDAGTAQQSDGHQHGQARPKGSGFPILVHSGPPTRVTNWPQRSQAYAPRRPAWPGISPRHEPAPADGEAAANGPPMAAAGVPS